MGVQVATDPSRSVPTAALGRQRTIAALP